jgi:RNA polymerase sigma factor (TIGR02999 family)
MPEVTRLLEAAAAGDRRAADDLLPVVYDELRKLAAVRLAAEKPGQTLEPTALVHEAYIRLVGRANEHHWDHRGHFFAAAAEAMRRILVENARRKHRLKRGGDLERRDLEPDDLAAPEPDERLLALDEALTRLSAREPEKAELVKLRWFVGLSGDAAADVLGQSGRPATRIRGAGQGRANLGLRDRPRTQCPQGP